MAIRRSGANARKVIRRLFWLAAGIGLVLLVHLIGAKTPLSYVLAGGWIAFLYFGPSLEQIADRLAKAGAPRVKGNDWLWRGARLVLLLDAAVVFPFRALGRAGRRTLAWFATTPAGRLIDRHRRRLAIALTLLAVYRLAVLALPTAAGADIPLWAWLTFGALYGLFGATAPIVALLAGMSRRQGAMEVFVIWHLLALASVVVSGAVAAYVQAAGGSAPHYVAVMSAVASLGLLAAELLLHIFALRWFGPAEKRAGSGQSQPTAA